jgi:hypothetical protein
VCPPAAAQFAPWNPAANGIYYNQGNVGIGTTNRLGERNNHRGVILS